MLRAKKGGIGSELTLIPLKWYNVAELRKKKNSGKGVIYIRPLQRDFDLTQMTVKEVHMEVYRLNYATKNEVGMSVIGVLRFIFCWDSINFRYTMFK